MESASPPLELLPDLPVEEPLDPAPLIPAPRAAAAPDAGKSTSPSQDPERTSLNFVDPEMFLAPGQETAIVAADPAPAAAIVPDQTFELTLEDPIVDELLTSPPPPAPAPPSAAQLPAARPPANPAALPVPPATVQRADTGGTARVPILKTPSLAAAASKLAAASAASQRTKPPVPAPAAVPGARPLPSAAAAPAFKPAAFPTPPADAVKPATPRPIPVSAPAALKPEVFVPTTPRAAAIAAKPPAPAPVVPAAASLSRLPAAKATSAAPIPKSAPQPATDAAEPASAAAATPPMDQDFIARNQVVERYLSGRLPVKGATDFERFCAEHPEVLDDIGLPERVNAGLRLLEASGKPEPWQEAPRPAWQKPQVTLALAATVAVLVVALAVITGGSVSKTHRIAELQKEVHDRVLDPASSTREIRLLPSRTGASNVPAITIGGVGAGTQLADFRIDESRSQYHAFKVTIDRIDQGRVGVISNLAKDSNGHLRIALNSSALGPGTYQLTLEGLDWRGEPQPDSWVTIGITR
jgi:hypothetical protein